MRTCAILAGLAATIWFMLGANMIVTADNTRGANAGLAVCIVGLVLAWLCGHLMMRAK